MKKLYPKSLYLVFTLIVLCQVSIAQNFNNKGFSFQGYARNIEGAALSSENIEVQFTIYQQGQAAEFSEVHTATTDAFGVFHLVVGAVNSVDFIKLDFISKADYKLRVQTRVVGGTYATISDAVMQSVPYAQAADNGVPVGSLIIFAGPKANIPAGWLACDGTNYDNTLYPKLFAAIGTAWGGNSSQFRVPDMRGLFTRGVDNGSLRDPNRTTRGKLWPGDLEGNTGDNVGSYQGGEIQNHAHGSGNLTANSAGAHTHSYNDPYRGSFNIQSNLAPDNRTKEFPDGSGTTGNSGAHTHSISGNTSPVGGNETRPVNANVWYIIRAR